MTSCLKCKNLNQIFRSKLAQYRAARSATLYRISTKFAAIQLVDMERARNEREEHWLICPSAATRKCVALAPRKESFALVRFQVAR
jgi:hypothetical protein